MKLYTIAALAILFITSGFLLAPKDSIDDQLRHLLNDNHFDGKIQEELEKELGRKLNTAKINLGKLIFF